MTIKSDKWIRRMAEQHGMIEPFEPGQIRQNAAGQKIVSYGTSSYGYDIRCAPEFKVFTNIHSTVVDPKNFDEKSFVDFNDEVYLDTDFTSDTDKMEQALSKIPVRGGTAMRDAIRMAINHLKKGAKRDKKVLLVVTDGNDNASVINLEGLVREAQNSGVLLYAIGLLTEEERSEAKKAKRSLDLLTEATGGEAFYPKDVADVDRIAHHVAHDLRNQYSIAYSPTNPKLDGSYRQIKVVVSAPGRPIARTRSGYYANANTTAKR